MNPMASGVSVEDTDQGGCATCRQRPGPVRPSGEGFAGGLGELAQGAAAPGRGGEVGRRVRRGQARRRPHRLGRRPAPSWATVQAMTTRPITAATGWRRVPGALRATMGLSDAGRSAVGAREAVDDPFHPSTGRLRDRGRRGAAAGYVGLVTGACPVDLGVGRRVRPLGPQLVDMAAPREVVFDVIAQPYLGGPHGRWPTSSRVLERATTWCLPSTSPRWGAAGPGRPDGGDGPVHPARAGRLPAGPRAGSARRGGVRAHRASRWCRHAACLRWGDRGRPGGSWDSAGVSWWRGAGNRRSPPPGGSQGRSRTARVKRRGTPAPQPRPTAPNHRAIARHPSRGHRSQRALCSPAHRSLVAGAVY